MRPTLIAILLVSTPVSPGLRPPDRESLLAADRAASTVSVEQGFRRAVGEALAENGILLYSGAPIVQGRDVGALLAAQPLLGSLVVRWQPLRAEMSRDGEFGVTWGVTITLPRAEREAEPRLGKYVTVWRWSSLDGWRAVAMVHLGVVPPSRTVAIDVPVEWPSLVGGGVFVSADRAFAGRAARDGASAAFAAYADSAAVTFPASGEVLRGPVEIGASLEKQSGLAWHWYPVASAVAESGDLGFTIGQSEIVDTTSPGHPSSFGKYLTIWRWGSDGSPRYILDAGNGRPAP